MGVDTKIEAANERITPFSCGSQFADWQCSNCDHCAKAPDDLAGGDPYRCTVLPALDRASLGDGTIDAATARLAGITPETRGRYVWPCGEVEWTPEWKAEWARRQTRRYRLAARVHQARRRLREVVRTRCQSARERLLFPVAHHMDARDPESCWAAWAGWAMGYTERPSRGCGKSCKAGLGAGEACWCGKFRGPGAGDDALTQERD